MKHNYENRYRFKLTRRIPIIIRLDGKSFHTVTKNFEKPFSNIFHQQMCNTARTLLKEIQGAKLAYIQSDEISILITDFDTIETDAWFDYNLQKICSISASIASVKFSVDLNITGLFDCRVFNIPKEEVNNYFIWRQIDWIRNSLQMYTRNFYSHKECRSKKKADMHEMLYAKGKNWATDLGPRWKNGTTIYKKETGLIIEDQHLFKNNLNLVEEYLK